MALLSDAERADLQAELFAAMTEPCALYRDDAGLLRTTCRVQMETQGRQTFDDNSRLNETYRRVLLPLGTGSAAGDVLLVGTAPGTLYVAMETLDDDTVALCERVTCLWLGPFEGVPTAPHAALRANAFITVTRGTGDAAGTIYQQRGVRLNFPPPYEQGGPGSGGPLIVPAVLWDTADADYQEGDTVTLTQQSGYQTIPAQQLTYSVQFVANVGSPRLLLRIDLVAQMGASSAAEEFRPNATVVCMRNQAQVGGERQVQLVFPTSKERVAAGAVTLPATLRDEVDADWEPGDYCRIVSLVGVTRPMAIKSWSVGGVIRHPSPRLYLEADLTGPL